MRRFSVLAQLSALLSTAVAYECFAPNNELIDRLSDFAPCAMEPVQNICCAINRLNPPGGDLGDNGTNWTRDECLSNGVCMNKYTYQGSTYKRYWAEYCTDKDIKSGKCLNVCADERDPNGARELTPCDATANSTKWCCGRTRNCCDSNTYITIPQLFVGSVSIGPQSSSSAASPSSTATTSISSPASTNSPTASPSSKSGELSAGAKAGIGIAVGMSVVALLGAGFLAVKAKQWRRGAKGDSLDSEGDNLEAKDDGLGARRMHAHMVNPSAELESYQYPTELPRGPEPSELQGHYPLKNTKDQGENFRGWT